MKRRENLLGARCSLFELNEACQESERDRVFFRNNLHIITSKFVYLLEKCDKRQKVYGRSEVLVLLKIIRLVQVE